MTHPVRLRLSRAKGFDLQALSLRINGLRAIAVARPGKWGNPFIVSDTMDRNSCVDEFRKLFRARPDGLNEVYPSAAAVKLHLGGKNLACWCALNQPCHADVLLKIANQDHFADTNNKGER